MRINFILNAMSLSGGVKAEFMLAHEWQKHGHTVNVVYPYIPPGVVDKVFRPERLIKEVGYNLLDRWKPVQWYGNINVLKVPTLHEIFIPDADICIAHSWEANYYMHDYGASKGVQYYHVQDPEDWDSKNDGKRIKGYGLGQQNIVTSQFVKRIVERYANADIVMPHAPDHNIFYPDGSTVDGDVRILINYRREKYRCVDVAVEAYNSIDYPNKKLVMFGPTKYKDVNRSYPIDEYWQNPTDDELRSLYNTADMFVFPSSHEGWGMPPMEAMACGTAVVATSVGAVPEYMVNGVSGIIVEPENPKALAQGMMSLLDAGRRTRIGHQGYMAMKKYRWENSALILEKIFERRLHDNKSYSV